jgi:uncharacterized RDD family membrane protein YckC
MQEEWYVELEGVASGPHARQDLWQMRDAGKISVASLVWRQGFADWMRYAEAGLEAKQIPLGTSSGFPSEPEQSLGRSDAALVFELPTGGAPRTDTERDHENNMRRMMTQRNAARGHADFVPGLPAHAPRLEVEDDGWQWTAPAPWRRYLARTLDILMLGWFTWMVLGIVLLSANRALFSMLFTHGGVMNIRALSSVIVSASLIPVQALLIGTSGTTIGKWIFGVRITRRDGRAIGFRAALAREASVFGFGMAGGIPLVAFVPIFIAYQVLTRTGSTQWDRGKDWVVTQREPGDAQTWMFALGLAALIFVGTLIRHYEVLFR